MIGAAPWDDEPEPEWRRTIKGRGWHTVYPNEEPDRTLISTWCKADADAVREWERQRAERLHPRGTGD